jgi:hypothetical protein
MLVQSGYTLLVLSTRPIPKDSLSKIQNKLNCFGCCIGLFGVNQIWVSSLKQKDAGAESTKGEVQIME